jgi:hypothetical protein
MGTHGQGRRVARGRGPRGRRRYGLALAALLAGVAVTGDASATHPSWFKELRLNVDGDRAAELVRVAYDVSSDHKLERGSITARDTCGGRRVQVALVPAGKYTPALALRPAQLGRAAVGVVADYRDGSHLARVVRLRSCRAQVLLSFSTPAAASLQLEARNDSARFPGREVVAVEGLRDAARRTFFRWAPVRQRYVKYKTTFSVV